jgi:hypothetical protein
MALFLGFSRLSNARVLRRSRSQRGVEFDSAKYLEIIFSQAQSWAANIIFAQIPSNQTP